MTTISGALFILSLFCGGPEQEPTADQTMTQVSRSAEQELAKSIQELNTLRAQIAAEKLPLSQELTALEEQLSQLRRDHDQVTRLVDAGNLEISTLKNEVRARQDELTYIGNLLDEYARNFETKVHVSELQYCGEALETAKQATENTTLTPAEKFARQTQLADVTLTRLSDAVGGMRFPGVGVDLQGTVASGQFAMIGPIALFRGEGGGATGIVVPQTGSSNPLIRPLDEPLQAGIVSLFDTGDGLLPLDPSLGGALKELVQKSNLIHIFKKGGPIMWPLLAAAILALVVVLERLFFLFREKIKRDPKALDRFFGAVMQGDLDAAVGIAKKTKFYVVRALGYALEHKEQSLANGLLYAQAQELKRFKRGIPILDTVITLAPLLGLLGTVTGMMGSFSLIGGELSAPGAITGGIAEALIATAFGLGIAITALLPFNFLNARLDDARHEIESAATQLELLVGPTPVAPLNGDLATEIANAPEANDLDAVLAVREAAAVRELALRRKRDALRKQMAELETQLEEHEVRVQVVPRRERHGVQEPRQPQTAKE